MNWKYLFWKATTALTLSVIFAVGFVCSVRMMEGERPQEDAVALQTSHPIDRIDGAPKVSERRVILILI